VAETNVGWVSHESTYLRDDRACKPDASELQEAVMLKTVQEGGINESDDNDLSSRQISTIVYPGDGKSVEDKLKQCVSVR
jgi:hypothetical protein